MAEVCYGIRWMTWKRQMSLCCDNYFYITNYNNKVEGIQKLENNILCKIELNFKNKFEVIKHFSNACHSF